MLLYGASGHCKVIIDCLLENGKNISGIFDDNPSVNSVLNYAILGKYDAEVCPSEELIISVGLNHIRKKLTTLVKHNFGIAIHPSAVVSRFAQINYGTVIFQKAVIQSSSKIGEHVIVNTSSSIDHDCTVENFTHISPNAALSGNVFVGEGTHIGTGASVIQGIKIGKWCTIGAGAVVIRDIPDYAVVVGNPGRIIKHNNFQGL